jgi:hypothetical protein
VESAKALVSSRNREDLDLIYRGPCRNDNHRRNLVPAQASQFLSWGGVWRGCRACVSAISGATPGLDIDALKAESTKQGRRRTRQDQISSGPDAGRRRVSMKLRIMDPHRSKRELRALISMIEINAAKVAISCRIVVCNEPAV